MTALQPNDFSQIAFSTLDLKSALQYFNRVLGLPLVALHWKDRTKKTAIAILELNTNSMISLVYSPENPSVIELCNTHPGQPVNPSTRGTMQHLAFNVDNFDDLLAMRDRIRSHKIFCLGPIDHGFAHSIYFAGPEGMTLEIATYQDVDLSQWIDPKVISHLKISGDELAKLCNPA